MLPRHAVSDFPKPNPVPGDVGGRGGPQRVDSRSLFDGTPEILIVHGGEDYRLRITRQGKLILTK